MVGWTEGRIWNGMVAGWPTLLDEVPGQGRGKMIEFIQSICLCTIIENRPTWPSFTFSRFWYILP